MKKKVAIIGGGSSALVLAAMLEETKFEVIIYERNAALGRKFLVAGDGGFNVTHSESSEQFISRYSPGSFIKDSFTFFNNKDVCEWFKHIGIETYIGSSKRVFPLKGVKPIDVLNAILVELKRKNVHIKTSIIWKGWDQNRDLIFSYKEEELVVKADIKVFALGGKSWSVTGSDGSWFSVFEKAGIAVQPFYPSNCAYEVQWNSIFL
jgi:predicted Rossmann fold flavoprotein